MWAQCPGACADQRRRTANHSVLYDAGPAYGRYGALPSTFDATALDEISLYGDLLQAVAEYRGTGKRLDSAAIDRALGVVPDPLPDHRHRSQH